MTRIEHRGEQSLASPYSNRLFGALQVPTCAVATAPSTLRMHSLQRAWVVSVDEPQPDRCRPVAVQFDWLYQGEVRRRVIAGCRWPRPWRKGRRWRWPTVLKWWSAFLRAIPISR